MPTFRPPLFKKNIQLIYPSAMDDAGLLMLDSVREIFDILDIPFESVKFNCEIYNKLEDLVQATFVERKCPIIEFPGDELSHVMIATGIFHTQKGYFVECKDSRREDPHTPPGKNFHQRCLVTSEFEQQILKILTQEITYKAISETIMTDLKSYFINFEL